MAPAEREYRIFKKTDEVADFALKRVINILYDEVQGKGCATMALSGGTTPLPLYKKLSEHKGLPWDKIHVLMVDERYVPYIHEDNNFRMINESLLIHVNIPAKNVHPIMTSDSSAVDAALKYEDDLKSFFGLEQDEMPVLDLMILGIGEDGHTASLFPGSPALKEIKRLAVEVPPPEGLLHERITMTLPVINNSRHIIMMATGENKSSILNEILAKGNRKLPASMVRPRNGEMEFLIDRDAARLLK